MKMLSRWILLTGVLLGAVLTFMLLWKHQQPKHPVARTIAKGKFIAKLGSGWFVRSSTACPTNGNGTSSSCAASPGGAGAWSGFANIGWGSIHAGDTLSMQAGDTYAEQLTIGASGTSGSPVTITVNGVGTAIIDGGNARTGFSFNGQSFVNVDGVTGNAAFGGSQTYGIRVINIGLPNYCAYINNGEQHVKFLHVECSGNGQNTDNAHLNAPPVPDDNRGGVFGGGGAHFVEIAYDWFHTQMAQYNLSTCSISGTTYTCTTTTTITDTHWTSPSVIFASIGIYGNTGVNGHCGLISASGTTFTCEGGGSGTGTGGVAVMEWAATAVTGFFATGSTNYNDNTTHDNFAYGTFNDGFRSNGNGQIYHNEAQAGMGSGHSDATLAQSALYVEISSNYVHDWNDQNCYLDQLSAASRGHIRIFNNVWNSPHGFGGCNVDPEGASANWDDIVMINNTSYSSRDYVVRYGNQGGTVTNFVYINNISRVSGSVGDPPWAGGGGIAFASSTAYNYNLYSPTLGVQFPILANFSGGNKTLAQLRALSPPRELNGNTCDVTYVGGALPAGAQPASTDTCSKNAGQNLTAIYPFATVDFNGVTRPPTAAWDSGAMQASGGGGGTPVIGFSPNPAAFGNQIQGTTSAPLTITVSNSGTAAQVLSTPYWTITGTNASNFANAGTGTCVNGGTIAISGSCTVNLTFTPSATGARTATFNIQGTVNASDNLTGTGTLPTIGLAPSPAAFGNQVVGTPSSPLTVTVSNTGTSTQTLASPYFTITGTNSADFSNLGTGTCVNGGSVPASSSCTINLRFTPAAAGARTATLNLLGTVNASDSLTGTGTQAAISITPSPGAFGNQNVNTTSGPLTLTVTNTGTATETLATPYFTLTGTNSTNFANAGSGTCANGGTIAASASCTVNLTFTPSAAGARSGTLNILGTVNGTDALTGTGVAPLVSLSPNSIAFANQTTNTSSGNQAVTLTNTGTATLNISSITLVGANAAEFSTNSSTCGATLTAGASCSLNVVFTPTTVGSKSANLTFTTDAATSPDSVALTGTGVVPAVPVLSFSPSPGAFGNQLQNTTSAGLTITVSNIGTGPEVLSTPFFTITGANGSDFARSGGTCVNGGAIVVSGSCTVILTFTPAATGSRTGTLNISGTANGSNVLTGTGIQPIIGLSPSPVAFGNQLQGTTSAPLTVTVSNSGTGTETLATPFFTITGTNASNFARSGGTCVNAGTIAPSASCTIILTFTPSATGARSATLTVQGTVNATDSLTGTGTLPAIALSPSPVAFSNQNLNTTSSPLTVTVSNTGTASEVLATPYFTITGTNSTNFANAGTGSCANGGTVAASASCTINLTFTPSATGARTGVLNVLGTVNATANITGTGVAAVVSLNPTTIAFGNQTTSTSSGNHLETLTNTGNGTLTISSIALTGADSGQFSTNGSTCGATLAAAASCSLNVVFSPTTIGAKAASLTFSTSAASSPDNVTLSGTGVSAGVPVLSFSPTPADFGSQAVATTGPPLTITVTNIGTAAEVLSTPYFTIGGANGTNFANTAGGTCVNGGTIAANGASCTIVLTFTPTALGTRSGSLTIVGTVNGTNPLTGIGTGTGTLSLNPTSIAFGNQDSGTSSNPRSVILTNTGTLTLTISSIALTGTNANQFSIDTNTCGATLAVSASCSWNVVFSPNLVQSNTASVTITSTATSSPDNIPLTGTGRSPTPPSTPAPAIVIVRAFPTGSVLVAENVGVTPKNFQVSSTGCSQDGVNFQNPCRFAISCGNCGRQTTARFNGTAVSQSFSRGTVTVSVPITLFTMPALPTEYQISLLN